MDKPIVKFGALGATSARFSSPLPPRRLILDLSMTLNDKSISKLRLVLWEAT